MEGAFHFALQKLMLTNIEFKDFQKNVICGYTGGKDVFCCIPTGMGKSLCYEAAPFMFDYLCNSKSSLILVIQPLVALMKEQVKNITEKGIPAVYLGDKDIVFEEAIIDAKFIFTAPESLSDKNQRKKILLHPRLQYDLKLLVIDESHCIKKLGKDEDSKNEKAFRKEYGQLGELRSYFKDIPVLALTATSSAKTTKIIVDELCMQNCHYVTKSPNKPNIKYVVLKTQDDLFINFKWLIEELFQKGINCERYIIFCRRTKHVSELFTLFSSNLKEHGYNNYTNDGINDDRNRLFAMFHSGTDENIKQTVQSSFAKVDSTLRVVFCTSAFGMGLDIKEVSTVIHYGPPNEIDDYIQESGRVGRSPDNQCYAILLAFTKCTAGHVDSEMKHYCTDNTKCKRMSLFKSFDSYVKPGVIGHKCCSFCTKICRCMCSCFEESYSNCDCSPKCFATGAFGSQESEPEHKIMQYQKDLLKMQSQNMWNDLPKVRDVTVKQQQECHLKLTEYVTGKVSIQSGWITTQTALAFSMEEMRSLISGLAHITTKEHVEKHFPLFNDLDVDSVWNIVCTVLESQEEEDTSCDELTDLFLGTDLISDDEL